MKIKLLITFIFNFLFSFSLLASTIAGGEITYKHLGKKQFEITFKVYRDCREATLSGMIFTMHCQGMSAKTLYPSLVSIRDISNTCKTGGIKCKPANTTISTTIPVFEEHTFTTKVDFDGTDSAYKKCCAIIFGMKNCCRSGQIVSGAAYSNFFVSSTFEMCKAPTNSSPVFSIPPPNTVGCNFSFNMPLKAYDNIDGDSLSYSFTEPQITLGVPVSWTKPYSAQRPFSDYFPSGWTDKTKSNPNVDPPIGTYLNPENGMLSYTPTNCSETSIMAVSLKEWRKDSSGKYQQIGEIIREAQFIVSPYYYNNPPKILPPFSFNACEGVPSVIDIVSYDVNYNPPPPSIKKLYDTTFLDWDYSIKGATFSNDTAKLKTGRFTWIPPRGSSRIKPYEFTVMVRDNACDINAVNYKTISIFVKPGIKLNHKILKINNNTLVGIGGPDSTFKGSYTQQWQVLDSVGNPLTINKNYPEHKFEDALYYFIKPNLKNHSSDTIHFRRNGKYIISHTVNAIGNCFLREDDTVTITGITMEVALGQYGDTLICQPFNDKYYSKVTNGKRPITYKWSVPWLTVTDTLGYIDNLIFKIGSVIEVEVTDALGNKNSASVTISGLSLKPNIFAGKDTLFCQNTNYKLKAKPLTKAENIVKWTWFSNGIIESTTDSLISSKGGTYIVEAVNKDGCRSNDTLRVKMSEINSFLVATRKFCQNTGEFLDTIRLKKPQKDITDIKWQLLKPLKNSAGNTNKLEDLLVNFDKSSLQYKIKFNQSVIDLGNSNKDSIKFLITDVDKMSCVASDSFTIIILKSPEIKSLKNLLHCTKDIIDLSKTTLSDLPLSFIAENKSGYDSWPNDGEIKNGIIKPNYFKNQYGNYFIKINSVNENCMATDSIKIAISPIPTAEIGLIAFSDSVRFTDNSSNALSRKWFVNKIFRTSNQSLAIHKNEVHLKPVRLELKNESCTFDTTLILILLANHASMLNNIKIYPNPATQTLTIETNQKNPYDIKVLNVLGQLVLFKKMNLEINILDVSNFNKGIYILEIDMDSVRRRLRFVKE